MDKARYEIKQDKLADAGKKSILSLLFSFVSKKVDVSIEVLKLPRNKPAPLKRDCYSQHNLKDPQIIDFAQAHSFAS